MKVDIVNMEARSIGRDIDIVEPILTYLELKDHLSVLRESIWYGEIKLLIRRPKLLLISNAIGSKHKARILKFANCVGIKTVALQSEGEITEEIGEEIERRLYGWKDKHDELMKDDLFLLWSERTKNSFSKVTNTEESNMKVSGATGFDRYQFAEFMGKEYFFKKYCCGKKYHKVIGIAGWCFDLFTKENLEYTRDAVIKYLSENKDFFISSRNKINQIYHDLVKNNPDYLFILKIHPEDTLLFSEFDGLDEYDNTILVHRQENIANIINVCDLWLAFDSTTCLEAWLLGKETILVNPCGSFENRSETSDGSMQLESYSELQELIDLYFKNKKITSDFIIEQRKRIIQNLMEFDDGKNHIRAANFVTELLHKESKKNVTGYPFIIKCIMREIAIFVICMIPFRYIFKKAYQKIIGIHSYYDKAEREQQRVQYKQWLTEFYKNRNLI